MPATTVVVDLLGYRRARVRANAPRLPVCRHCGATLMDGEIEDECSSATVIARDVTSLSQPARKRAISDA